LELLGFTITTIWAVIILFIWIAFAFWPARVASRKGYSFLLFFLFSLITFLIALLVAYMLKDKTTQSAPATTPAPSEQTTPPESSSEN